MDHSEDVLDLPREPAHMTCPRCGTVFTDWESEIGNEGLPVLLWSDTDECPNCGQSLVGIGETVV